MLPRRVLGRRFFGTRLPALLDRLTDHAPQECREPMAARVITKTRLRELVLGDLIWLLDATDDLKPGNPTEGKRCEARRP